jgi:hypothetical protein
MFRALKFSFDVDNLAFLGAETILATFYPNRVHFYYIFRSHWFQTNCQFKFLLEACFDCMTAVFGISTAHKNITLAVI